MRWNKHEEPSCMGLDVTSETQKDFYDVLGVEYDASEDSIRTNYLRLALKWHPDKHNGASMATHKFQEINEAYRVLSDPLQRREYDMQGSYTLQDYSITDYLKRFKGLILTCSGLGIDNLAERLWQWVWLHAEDVGTGTMTVGCNRLTRLVISSDLRCTVNLVYRQGLPWSRQHLGLLFVEYRRTFDAQLHESSGFFLNCTH